MVDDELSAVASIVGGSGGKPGRCFASVAGPQADDTRAPAIALGTTRSTINALRTPKDREQATHTTAKRTAAFTLPKQRGPESVRGFTLAELLVSMGVLVLLVLLFTQLLNSAATITILGHKQMDADSQARQLLDRMTIDFAQMVKRSDVDYYLKSSWFATGPPPGPTGVRTLLQPGNDQIAFYSTVPGYYSALPTPAPTYPPNSPLSLVAYRVYNPSLPPNPCADCNKLQRMGKGLFWNGVSTTDTPVVFIPIPVASPLSLGDVPNQTPTPTPTPAGSPAWPQAGNMASDVSYEVVGPQVFRFEYYYMLKTNGSFTDVPWDTSTTLGHYSVNGMRDVAAIIVDIALIDPKSKVLLSDDRVAQVASQLIDWGNTSCLGCPSQTEWQTTPGLLHAQWQNTLNGITTLPRPAISGIRVYERYFYLNK